MMAFTEDNSGAKQPEFGAQRAEPGKRWRRGVAMGKGMEWKRKLSGDQTQHEEFAEEAILGHGCPRVPASTSKARQGQARQGKARGRCWIRYRCRLAPEHPIYDPIFSFYSAVPQLSGDLEHGVTVLSEI